jgi:hypothetical protein
MYVSEIGQSAHFPADRGDQLAFWINQGQPGLETN